MGFHFKNKMHFVTIGYIEWRKGQDLLLDAVRMMPDFVLDDCEFLLVGQDSSVMAEKLREEIKGIPQIKMYGKVDRARLQEILSQADVLICPSREDPMPTVAAEAMAFAVPCILSDATGTAAYITEGINGLKFENENVEQLCEKICWCVNHKEEIKQMGKASERVFHEFFSVEVFECKILELVKEMIGEAENGKFG